MLDMEFNAFLQKPFEMDKLKGTILTVIEG